MVDRNLLKYRRAALRGGVAGVSIAAALMAIAAVPAAAQTEPAEQPEATEGEIVVTGSLIVNPNLERSSPVNVTTAEEIELNQSNVAEEILREIPGIVPNIGSAVNNGNVGASLVDLRGLGASRNIVLLDGNRITPGNLLGQVDLNNIPVALVDRVDVLTGGASTTYGADAISGVVNFITKKDFAGLEAAISEQITEQSDGNTIRADMTIGANFDDNRGNAVFSVGYQEADPVYQGDREFSVGNLDSFTGISGGGSGTAVPSRFSGTRPLVGGVPSTTAPFVQTGTTIIDPDGAGPLPGVVTPVLAAVPGGLANGGLRQVNAAGQGVNTFSFFNFNPYNIFQTPFERYNMYGAARYEVSDAVEVYSRGLFSKNNVKTIIAPSGIFGATVTTNLNNPYLPAALRNQLCAFNIAPTVTGVNASGASVSGQATYTPRFTPAECAAAATATGPSDLNYRTVTTTVNRRSVEAGPRISSFTTTIFDYRIGARGAMTDTINWDVTGGYGQSENLVTLRGFMVTSRVRQAALANNTTTCIDNSNGCVPLNLFGPEGSITAAQLPFVSAESTTAVRTSLAQARGTVSGDFGVSSPWAEEAIGFAAGGEYRKYGASIRSDMLAKTPGELGGAGGAVLDVSGGYDVYEAFGELVAPVVQDKPFFESLTFEAGVRYSSYAVDAPTSPSFNTTTYKFGGNWEPVRGVKIRGGYSHSVRAPNIAELFAPVVTGLTALSTDPCAGSAPTTNANLRAVCLAQGAPAGTIGSITNPTAGQANATSGGNLNLDPEVSNSHTIGAVFQPAFIPGLALSVDYYNIKVTGAITAPLPGDLILACFGATPTAPSASAASDPACTQIRRNPTTGGLDGDTATTPGLFAVLSNQGELKTDGIDLTANYKTDALGFAKLALSFAGNYTHASKFKANAADPTGLDRNCVGYYSPNCSFTGSILPKFQFSQRTSLSFDDNIQVSLLWRYIHGVKYEPQQQADDVAAATAGGCDDPLGADPDGCIVDPAYRTIKAAHYFDLTTRFAVTDEITLTLGVQNLLNKKPPIVGSLVGSTAFNSGNTYPSTYDALGRRYAASVKLRF